MQDSGLGSRSSPGFNTLPARLLVVPLSKALHAALLLSTGNGYLWGQICKQWRRVACERLYTPQGVEMDIQTDMDSKRSNDQGRYLSKSAEQSSEPGCGLKTVTLLTFISTFDHYWGEPFIIKSTFKKLMTVLLHLCWLQKLQLWKNSLHDIRQFYNRCLTRMS